MSSRLSAEHEVKVRAALEKIERAQNLIIEAAQDLCPVDGFCDEWSAAGPVHGAVKDYWYRVSGRLGELSREEGCAPTGTQP